MRFAATTILLASLLIVPSAIRAENSSFEIINTNLSSCALFVGKGETLTLSNVDICLDNEGSNCTLYIAKGGLVSATNTNFGKRVRIVHEGNQAESIELVNSQVQGAVSQGQDPNYGTLSSITSGQPVHREIVNTDLESAALVVEPNETLELSNVNICTDKNGPECSVTVKKGGAIDFTNVEIGKRVTIVHEAALLSQINLSNVRWHGEMTNKLSKEAVSATKVVAELSKKNDEIAIQLKEKGIAAAATPRGVVINLPDIYFEFDKFNLTSDATTNVDEISKILQTVSKRGISVEGHADAIGEDGYNVKLSKNRAETVARELEHNGYPKSQVQIRAFGEQRPVADNGTELGRAKNRRVEVIVENFEATPHTASLTSELNKRARFDSSRRVAVKSNRQREADVSISAPGVTIEKGRITAPGVEINENGIVAPGVVIKNR